MIIWAVLLAVVFAASLFFEWRNEVVYRIRMAFIDDEFFWPDGYRLLPSYDAMLYQPKFWHMRRKAQWEQYVLERGLLTGAFRPVATEGKK